MLAPESVPRDFDALNALRIGAMLLPLELEYDAAFCEMAWIRAEFLVCGPSIGVRMRSKNAAPPIRTASKPPAI